VLFNEIRGCRAEPRLQQCHPIHRRSRIAIPIVSRHNPPHYREVALISSHVR
jgi:hypothetical protein